MDLIRIAAGAALATFGRRLYWLFVAAMGFTVGLQFSRVLLEGSPSWLRLAIAIGLGMLGAIGAILLQRIGIGMAGFLAGAYISFGLLDMLTTDPGSWRWIVYLAAGIVGAILLSVVFDWALVVLSSIAGAVLIVQGLQVASPWNGLIFFAVLITGLILQGRVLDRSRTASPPAN